MPDVIAPEKPQPLTALTEDETMFRDNIRQFAEEKIRPLSKEMDRRACSTKISSINSFNWA